MSTDKKKKSTNPLRRDFNECICSGQAGILLLSDEREDAAVEISESCRFQGWSLMTWNAAEGMEVDETKPQPGDEESPASHLAPTTASTPKSGGGGSASALAAVKYLLKKVKQDDDPMAVLLMKNAHMLWEPLFSPNPEVKMIFLHLVEEFVRVGKSQCKSLVFLCPPGTTLPNEWMPLFSVIKHELPKAEDFLPILNELELDGEPVELSDEEASVLAKASTGMTRLQAGGAYGRSLTRSSKVKTEIVEEIKNQLLNANGLLKRWDMKVPVDPQKPDGPKRDWPLWDDIGGNDACKDFLMKIMQPESRKKRSKMGAVLLIGPPGTGKTLLAKALGNAVQRKTYGMNLSNQKSKWVGESEANTRRLFSQLTAMHDLVAYIDEVNEQVGGEESDGHSVDKALKQQLMEYLDTHRDHDDVLVVMTANDMSKMHMALTREGRVDAIWYVGLPGKEQKAKIWDICMQKYGLEEQTLPDDKGWAGVEIEGCCRKADNLNLTLVEASEIVIPSSVRVADQIERLRDWADGRVLDAETGKIYRKNKEAAPESTGHLPVGVRAKRKVRKLL